MLEPTPKEILERPGEVITQAAGGFKELLTVYELAKHTTENNFSSAKKYMERLPVQMQVLFLMLVIRPLPIAHPIKNLPEYAEWYIHKDVVDFLMPTE